VTYTTKSFTEVKTHKQKIIAHNTVAKQSLAAFADEAALSGRFLIENHQTTKAIRRIQSYRLISAAAEALKFQYPVSCHTLRKTFGYHTWKIGTGHVISANYTTVLNFVKCKIPIIHIFSDYYIISFT